MTTVSAERLTEAQQEATNAGDATGFLIAEHEWLRAALYDLRSMAETADADAGAEAFGAYLGEVSAQLDLHIRKEEEVFFLAIEPQMLEEGQGSTFDMYGEHDAIRIRRDELVAAVGKRAGIRGAFASFARSITVHFENEEELVFADAPGWITKEQGADLISKMQALA